MTATARQLADQLDADPPRLSEDETSDGTKLLRWLADDHFTFLGYRQ